MHLRLVLILWLAVPCFLFAQIEEDFTLNDVNELNNWGGDIDQFIINNEQQLQLNADEEGTSTLYTPFSISGVVTWELYFKMDFAPSNSNRLRIYLYSDGENLETSNGYFIEVGETGSDDNLEFYRQDNGSPTRLAEGVLSTLGSDPAEATIVVERDESAIWTIATAYDGDPFTQLEFELSDDTYDVANGFFALSCNYTSTRADKFSFDDIFVGNPRPDIDAPILISVELLGPSSVRLLFDELIDEGSGLNTANFLIDQGIGNPTSIEFGVFDNELILELGTPLAEGVLYKLSLANISDLVGNRLNTEVELIFATQPINGEIVINEILFDPYPDGVDFVELYNTTDKFLDISSLIISNMDNEQSRTIEEDIILKPFQYLAITSDPVPLSAMYMIRFPENIIQNSLPAFNNADGNVSLSLDGESTFLDSYSYTEDDHSPWIDDTEGVSLERVDPAGPTDDPDNWQSASRASGFATPGYVNSNFSQEIIANDEFTLEKKTFSPDGDGFDDFLQVNYRVSQSGFVLNMRVFDDRGHLVRTLASSEILGQVGSITWNGENDNGTLSGIGIYVIFLEYFNSEGSLHQKKLSCVLAKQLN